MKTEVIEDGGEVFQQAEYRALGWLVSNPPACWHSTN